MGCLDRIRDHNTYVHPSAKVEIKPASWGLIGRSLYWLQRNFFYLLCPLNKSAPGRDQISLRGKNVIAITSTPVSRKVMQYFRNDPKGPLFDSDKQRKKTILYRALASISETPPTTDDLVLTCDREKVDLYREVMLTLVGHQNRATIKQCVERVTLSLFEYLEPKEVEGKIILDRTAFAGFLTAATICGLLVEEREFSFSETGNASRELSVFNAFHALQTASRPISPELNQRYQKALPFIVRMVESSMKKLEPIFAKYSLTDTQKKGIILTLLMVGEDTPLGVFKTLFTALASIGTRQEEFSTLEKMEQLVYEILRLEPPSTFISRTARTDLEIQITHPNGESYTYPVYQNDLLLLSLQIPGQNPERFKHPELCNPFRPTEEQLEAKTLFWHPFGKGAHLCPGRALALEELCSIPAALLRRYEISTIESDPNFLLFTRRKPRQ